MPGANRAGAGGGSATGRPGGTAGRPLQAAFVGGMALGFRLLFLRPEDLDHRADDRFPQHVEPLAYDLDRHIRVADIDRYFDLAQRLRLDRTLHLAFGRKLTRADWHAECPVSVATRFDRTALTEFSALSVLID